MNRQEFSSEFDVLFNSITSNQAPGLNEYEKSLFLTKAQDELLKNYFLPQSNNKQAGFDGNQKRQMDFSKLMDVAQREKEAVDDTTLYRVDPRSYFYSFPEDVFLVINESIQLVAKKNDVSSYQGIRQVIPLSYEEYMRYMSKPYKNPNKNQAWRLMTNTIASTPSNKKDSNSEESDASSISNIGVEVILTNTDRKWVENTESGVTKKATYCIRYIRRPMPIILTDITDLGDDLTIGGCKGDEEFYQDGTCCELDESLHEEILQRAIELAKASWTATGQDNTQVILQTGQRSE